MRIGLGLIALVGCSFSVPPNLGGPDAAPNVDAPPGDGGGSDGVSEPDALTCYGTGASYTICGQVTTPALAVNSPTEINTDSAADCSFVATPAAGPALCVRAAHTIEISSTLSAFGSRPLVLLATDSLVVTGTIDVASHRGLPATGPAANSPSCIPPSGAAGSSNGGGGGAGGTFGSQGGDGGDGDGGNTDGGNAADVSSPPSFLRGGCRGANGGAGGTGATGGVGGAGGGAIYLLSGGSITLEGAINASGAGGLASPRPTSDDGGGGGGGGSGGMIVFHATTTLTATGATIFANGGGGAEGGDRPNDCDPGDDPSASTPSLGGARGAGVCGDGGDGGNGAGAVAGGVDGIQGSEGGGGGGGGGGVIQVRSPHALLGAFVVSPPPS